MTSKLIFTRSKHILQLPPNLLLSSKSCHSNIYDKNKELITEYKTKRSKFWKKLEESSELIEYIKKAKFYLDEPIQPGSIEDLYVNSEFDATLERTKLKIKRNLSPEEDLLLAGTVEDELRKEWLNFSSNSKNPVDKIIKEKFETDFKTKSDSYKNEWVEWAVDKNMVDKEIQVLTSLVPSLYETSVSKLLSLDMKRRWFIYNSVKTLLNKEKGTDHLKPLFPKYKLDKSIKAKTESTIRTKRLESSLFNVTTGHEILLRQLPKDEQILFRYYFAHQKSGGFQYFQEFSGEDNKLVVLDKENQAHQMWASNFEKQCQASDEFCELVEKCGDFVEERGIKDEHICYKAFRSGESDLFRDEEQKVAYFSDLATVENSMELVKEVEGLRIFGEELQMTLKNGLKSVKKRLNR